MSNGEFLDSGQQIANKVRALIEAQPSDAPVMMVVAFWGQGAEALFVPGKTYKVVCNLKMGSTNPAVIERLMTAEAYSVEVRHMPVLHAKVCLGKQGAVVSSANMSKQGLSLEESKSGWAEAGMYVPASDSACAQINSWAWGIWRKAKAVTQADLRAAQAAFDGRDAGSTPDPEESDARSLDARIDILDFGLTEGLLFKPDSDANPDNKLRAGSTGLHRLYAQCQGHEPSKRESWIIAYAANLLWVHAGHTAPWAEGEFHLPQDVVARWRDKKVGDQVVLNFLSWLAVADVDKPSPIQRAAEDLVTRSWERYTA